jgi:hypothetical protein
MPITARDAYSLYTRANELAADGTPASQGLQLLAEAYAEHALKGENLTIAAASLADRMSRVHRAVAEGRHVNNLGEVQSAGGAVDVACAEYEASGTFVKRMRYTLVKTEVITEAQAEALLEGTEF